MNQTLNESFENGMKYVQFYRFWDYYTCVSASAVDGGPGLTYMPFVVMEDLLDKLKLLNYEEVSGIYKWIENTHLHKY